MRNDRNYAIEAVAAKTLEIDREVDGLSWFLFGSAKSINTDANDIDVLVVCKEIEDAIVVRSKIDEIETFYQLHAIIMTEEEENELRFIVNQACVPMREWRISQPLSINN